MRQISRLIAILALCIGPLSYGVEPHASALNPPFEFPRSKITSQIEFRDESEGAAIYSASLFEDAKACKKRHEVNVGMSNTVTIPADTAVSFMVTYHDISYPTMSWCAAVFTITADGSDYSVGSQIQKEAKTCRFVVLKKTDSGFVKADEAIERTFKKPFIDGWCK